MTLLRKTTPASTYQSRRATLENLEGRTLCGRPAGRDRGGRRQRVARHGHPPVGQHHRRPQRLRPRGRGRTTPWSARSRLAGLNGLSVDGGNGHDTIAVHGSVSLLATLLGGQRPGHLVGGSGQNHMEGGNGNDSLTGGSAGDELDGGNGKDVLLGMLGNDTLLGGNGRDTLDGGEGDDSLTGGTRPRRRHRRPGQRRQLQRRPSSRSSTTSRAKCSSSVFAPGTSSRAVLEIV